MKRNLILVFLVAAGNTSGQSGADYIALGGNAANPYAAFSLANNPAYFSNSGREFAAWSQNKFTASNIFYGGVAGHVVRKKTAIGIAANYQGTGYFNRTTILAQLGQKWSDVLQVGIALGYSGTQQAEGYGSSGALTGKLGLQTSITKKMTAALVLNNPWVLNNTLDGNAAAMDICLGYSATKKTSVFVQFKNTIQEDAIFGIGLHHAVQEKIAFRLAIQNGYEPICAGIEFMQKSMRISLAGSYHTYLGFSPALSLKWQKQ